MVLMFTDLVGSVDLKTRLGNTAYIQLIARHDRILKEIVKSLPGAAVLKDTGDGFLCAYATASDGIRAALRFQWAIFKEPWQPEPLHVRVGLNIGEVAQLQETGPNPKLVGLAADFAARIMDLAEPGQILMTRTVFDDARQYLEKHPPVEDGAELPELKWLAHGPYRFKGGAEPIDVFEIGAVGIAPLCQPSDSSKAHRVVAKEDEDLLGWRPAAGAEVPGRDGWILDRRAGGASGESWIARHSKTSAKHFFKFCYDAEQLREFKQELKLFRLLRATLGDRDDIVQLHEVRLDEPPYFLETQYTKGGNLAEWAERRGGLSEVPLADRLEIVAAIAEAVGAAHSVGVIHKAIEPANILIQQRGDGRAHPCLADFGIGRLSDPLLGPSEVLDERSSPGRRIEDPRANPYAPPETRLGQPYTPQGDIYALGVLLYQMAVGDLNRPLTGPWMCEVEDEILLSDIAVCVEEVPSRRLASASELATRLRGLRARRRERDREARKAKEARAAHAAKSAKAAKATAAGDKAAREAQEVKAAIEAARAKVAQHDAGDRATDSTGRAIPFIKLRCGESTGQDGKVLKLVGRRFTFGRERGTVKVPAEMVSRRHAEFKLGSRGWVLRDLRSSNGTFLNGERIETARIRVGNIVMLGTAGAHYQVIGLEDAL